MEILLLQSLLPLLTFGVQKSAIIRSSTTYRDACLGQPTKYLKLRVSAAVALVRANCNHIPTSIALVQ